MVLTYRYRLLPSLRQHRALEAIAESQRQLYNAALQERIGAYEKACLSLGYFDQTAGLTKWRQEDPDAAGVPVNLQRATLWRLHLAFKGFFRRLRNGANPGFPRFRGKGRFNSFGFRSFCGIRLDSNALCFNGMPGRLRFHMHRPMPSNPEVVACTFRRDVKGWSVGLDLKVDSAPLRGGHREVGLDLGVARLATLSTGEVIPSLKAARRAAARLRVASRALQRRKQGSKGRKEARTRFQRLHRKIRCARSTHMHQATAKLVNAFDLIGIEAIRVQPLSRGVLAASFRDAAWSKFISTLRYKAEKAGVRLVEVSAVSSTQECSGCGTRVPKRLGDRVHSCTSCGLSLDRDVNAARNILKRAVAGPCLRNAAGCGTRAGGITA